MSTTAVLLERPVAKRARPVKIEEAPSRAKASGMCGVCAHAGACTYARAEEPILLCEEFEIAPAAGERAATRPSAAAPALGLCASCQMRDRCTFSRPDSGAWHCEEYR